MSTDEVRDEVRHLRVEARALRDAEATREAQSDALAEQARALRDEARAIRRALDGVAQWNGARRRRIVLLLALAIVLAIHAHEVGRQVCGHGVPGKADHVAHLTPTAAVCEVVWPEGTNRAGEDWPTALNALGFVLYGLAGGLGWAAFAPHRRRDDDLDKA